MPRIFRMTYRFYVACFWSTQTEHFIVCLLQNTYSHTHKTVLLRTIKNLQLPHAETTMLDTNITNTKWRAKKWFLCIKTQLITGQSNIRQNSIFIGTLGYNHQSFIIFTIVNTISKLQILAIEDQKITASYQRRPHRRSKPTATTSSSKCWRT